MQQGINPQQEYAVNFVMRGNYALEDRQFQTADQFFEQALNADANCAEAYFGKFLVQVRCPSMDAFVQYRLQATAQAQVESKAMHPRTQYIDQKVNAYAVEPLLSKDTVRQMFRAQFFYETAAPQRIAQYKQEENLWNNNTFLRRTERLATGDFAHKLNQAKGYLFGQLDSRVKAAQQAEQASLQKRLGAYNAFLQEAERKAQVAHQAAMDQLEGQYLRYKAALDGEDAQALTAAEAGFLSLGAYKDSAQLAASCGEKLTQLTPEEKTVPAENSKKKTTWIIISAAASVVMLAAIILGVIFLIPKDTRAEDYAAAEDLYDNGQYLEAAVAFADLGEYKDSKERVVDCNQQWRKSQYATATQLMQDGDAEGAMELFLELGDYMDSPGRAEECRAIKELDDRYKEGEALLAAGDKYGALVVFRELGNHKDAPARAEEVRLLMVRKSTLDAHEFCIGIKNDGTVLAKRTTGTQNDTLKALENVVDVAAGYKFALALCADGTVIAAGDNTYGQCKVTGWTDMVAVDAGETFTLGLKKDGKVSAVGSNKYGQTGVSRWEDMIAISAGTYHSVGLKTDGTVEAVGWNKYGQCAVSGWTDIVKISAGYTCTVGLKADGTVVVAGGKETALQGAAKWTDIVDISAGKNHIVGLKSDGTVVAVGSASYGQTKVTAWTDVVSVCAGSEYTVALKADGTTVCAGKSAYQKYFVWSDIRLPEE